MRFTRIVAIFLTLVVPCAAYAQQSKKPRPPSRTTAAPQRPRPTPSVAAGPPRMTLEKAFYYFVAIYGAPDDVIDRYAKIFDASNYERAMADEFERRRYRDRIQARIADGVRGVDFNEKFTFLAYARMGEYTFSSHSFPIVGNSFQKSSFCVGQSNYLSGTCYSAHEVDFGVQYAVNGSDFQWSVPMTETDASAFVKSRAIAGGGEVDRGIVLRIICSVVNKKGSLTFSPFIYSVEAYSDKSLTAKLGVIPKINSLGANTAEELRLATIAAKTPTKEIGKYRGYSYCRQPKSDGKIHDPFAPPCDQWSRSFTLTDVGVALVDEKPGAPPETHQFNFFDSPTATLWRVNDSEYWNPIAKRVELKYGIRTDEGFGVTWHKGGRDFLSCHFESRQERDRFFVDLSRAFQDWKTKYAPFQFSAGDLKIDQRCLVGQTLVECPSSTPPPASD